MGLDGKLHNADCLAGIITHLTLKPENRQSRKNENRRERDGLNLFGGQGRDRTGDTRIFSPLLYQLSYLATAFGLMVGAQGFEPWTQ